MTAPAPRLEFRWRNTPKNEEERQRAQDFIGFGTLYFCDYGLVLPLGEMDIRAEDEDGNLGVHKEVFYCFRTTLTRSTNEPETGYVPFRDGAHAKWDSQALNELEIWCVDLHGNRQRT